MMMPLENSLFSVAIREAEAFGDLSLHHCIDWSLLGQHSEFGKLDPTEFDVTLVSREAMGDDDHHGRKDMIRQN